MIDQISALGSKAVAVTGNINRRVTANKLVSCAYGLGGLCSVVKNIGTTYGRMLFNIPGEEWDVVIVVYLRGHFLLTYTAAMYWRTSAKKEAK